MKIFLRIISLLFVLLMNDIAAAQDPGPLSGLSALSESDIRNSAIAFVNTTSSPGLEGATLNVDDDLRNSDQLRSSLGFNAEITMKDHIFNGYWGLGLVAGTLKDKLQFTSDNGQPVNIDLRRDIVSLRGTAGLSFPINQHFKLLPVLTLAVSDVRTRSTIDGLVDNNNDPTILSFDNSVQMISSTGSINALYWHWYDNYKLELSAHYNQIYTDAVSEDNPILDTHVWHQTSQFKSRISGPTSLTTKARPWRWQAYVHHTKFISQDKRALGYTGLFEIGTGLEWQLNVKPLDWFGWQYIGFSAGIITSQNVDGFNVGLTAR